jgi:hypothetical protein
MKLKYVGKDHKQPIDWERRIEHHLKEISKGKVPDKLLADVLKKD